MCGTGIRCKEVNEKTGLDAVKCGLTDAHRTQIKSVIIKSRVHCNAEIPFVSAEFMF
jgi:hypothetical protein